MNTESTRLPETTAVSTSVAQQANESAADRSCSTRYAVRVSSLDVVPCGRACTWIPYRKHLPVRGMRREHTRSPSPARYLSGIDVQATETKTVESPDRRSGGDPGARRKYARAVGVVIGWDDGEDANHSYVECTSLAFHGRPMAEGNPQLRMDERSAAR